MSQLISVLKFSGKSLIFAILKQWILQQRETGQFLLIFMVFLNKIITNDL